MSACARLLPLALLACAVAAAQSGIAPAADAPAAAAWAAPASALVHEAAAALAPARARVEVIAGTLDPRLQLAPCRRVEPFLPPGSRPWGRTRVGLRCVEGERAWTVYLPLTVRLHAPALVLRRTLPAGAPLAADAFELAEADWTAGHELPLLDAAAAVGRTLKRPLAAGSVLRSGDLAERRWFAAGDTVRVVAVGSGFTVSGEGQALADGLEGRSVRVRTDNGRVLSGRATGERRVEVPL